MPRGPVIIAVSPDGARAYVTNYSTNSVSVINTATNTVIATATAGAGPSGVAVTPNGAFAYVSTPSRTPSSTASSAKQFPNPSFKNQGQCLSYVNHL